MQVEGVGGQGLPRLRLVSEPESLLPCFGHRSYLVGILTIASDIQKSYVLHSGVYVTFSSLDILFKV